MKKIFKLGSILTEILFVGGGVTVLSTSCETQKFRITDIFTVQDDHIITGFQPYFSVSQISDNFSLNFSEYGIDQIGNGTDFLLSPFVNDEGTRKTNYNQIVAFYKKLSSLSLKGCAILNSSAMFRGWSTGSYMFFGVNFDNLTNLNLSDTDWAYAARNNESTLGPTTEETNLQGTGNYSFSNCRFDKLTTLTLTNARFSYPYMGSLADRYVETGSHFFYRSNFKWLYTIDLNGTIFANDYMNCSDGGSADSGSAACFFSECNFAQLRNIKFGNAKFANVNMNRSAGGRYSDTCASMFESAKFESLVNLELTDLQLAAPFESDTDAAMTSPRTGYRMFYNAEFDSLTTIDFSNCVLSTTNTANNRFAASMFASASFVNLSSINFRSKTGADFSERYNEKIMPCFDNTTTWNPRGGTFYTTFDPVSQSDQLPSTSAFAANSFPDEWEWTQYH